MTAQLRRKNNGKQFALVHDASRFIFDWYRPGDALPKVVSYGGKSYMLDKAAVEAAKVAQRVFLREVTFNLDKGSDWTVRDPATGKAFALVTTEENRKGTVYSVVRDTKWDNWKNAGAMAGVAVAALGCAGLIADHLGYFL